MTGETPGIGRKDSSQPYQQASPGVGTLGGHKVTKEEGIGPDVPGKIFNQNALKDPQPYQFTAKPQKAQPGGLLGLIVAIFNLLFGSKKQAPVKVKEPTFQDPTPTLNVRYQAIKGKITEQPTEILQLRADIEKELTSLREVDISEITVVGQPINPLTAKKEEAIKQLEALKEEITGDIEEAVKQAREEVESNLPHEELERKANALQIRLEGETFAEKCGNFLSKLEGKKETIEAAEGERNKQVQRLENNVRAAEIKLDEAKKRQAKELKKAEGETEKLIAMQKEAYFLQWENEHTQTINSLVTLKDELPQINPERNKLQNELNQLIEVQQGRVKTKGGLLSKPKTRVLTQQEEQRLQELPNLIAAVAKTDSEIQQEAKIAQKESEILSLKEQAWKLNEHELTVQAKQAFGERIKELKDEKNLPEYAQLETAQKALTEFQEKNRRASDAYSAFLGAQQAARGGLVSVKMKDKDFQALIQKLMTLSYLQKLDADFQPSYRYGLDERKASQLKQEFEGEMKEMLGLSKQESLSLDTPHRTIKTKFTFQPELKQ